MKKLHIVILASVIVCAFALVFYFGFLNQTTEQTVELPVKKSEDATKNLPLVFNGVKKMILIPSGKFVMGDDDSNFSDEKPEHFVSVGSFYMDETPVTYADFQKYIDDGGNKTRYWVYDTYNKPENPISGINWYHAIDYCNWRSEKEGLAPVYKPTNKLDAWGYPLWELDSSANGYRLPTEAEFEYAARGGLEKKKFPWGDEFNPRYANYDNEKGLMIGDWWRLSGVKDTPANGYGLYGMSGNVWQWTNDWYDQNYYSNSSENNLQGAQSGRTKVIRGGSWGNISPEYLRVSKRSAMAPSNYNYDVGFRCVRLATKILAEFTLHNVTNKNFYEYEVSQNQEIPSMDIYSASFVNRLGQFIADYYPNSIYFQTQIDQQEIINPQKIAQLIVDVSKEYSIHPLFLTGIIASESGFGCCSFPRWYNNPMAYHWQNALMKNGLPLYDADRTRNRKYKDLRDAFSQYAEGIKRNIYLNAAKKDLDVFHLLYVGYRADEWMYTLSKVYKDVLGITLSPHVPSENVGRYIYVDKKTLTNNENAEILPVQLKIIDRLLPLSNSEPHLEADKITHVVIHFSSNVIAKPNNPYIPEDVINIFKQYGVSAHYLIARDGTIFRLVNENRNAYHAGGSLTDYPLYTDKLNRHSIGIELLAIGTENEMKQYISPEIYATIPKNYIGYTNEQYKALNFLLPQIYQRYNIRIDRDHVIGHDEYSIGTKKDPGSLFDWIKIGF
ncbi:MAG: SUMF1/EgtB/PvdO family nonheme iron enzyme [Candidatus Pacebacteria bacterium]|nr:SUMF1/EgtB/PvdO family nonheme iron enzyme [Candidatus Paceibacterota bacterium]